LLTGKPVEQEDKRPVPTVRSLRIALALSAAIVPAFATGSALARPSRLGIQLQATHAATAGSAISVSVHTRARALCSLAVSGRGSRETQATLRTDGKGRAAWRWLVPSKAPSGVWRMRAACARGNARGAASRNVRLRRGSTNRFGPLIGNSTSQATRGQPLTASAALDGASARIAAANPFPVHQCTWWAYEKRPDIFNYAKAHGDRNTWNGGQWLANATAAGELTGKTPQAGALGVFLPYRHGSYGYGHVFYVESVNPNGTITISEYNWRPLSFGTRTIPASEPDGFIYGPPGGSVQTPAPPPVSSGPQPQTYHVYGTGADALAKHTGPSVSAPRAGALANGSPVSIACQTQSSSAVNGSSIWDKLQDGNWVSDYYVDTPVVGHFTPGIPACSSSPSDTGGGPPPPPPPPPPTNAPVYVAPPGATPQAHHVYGTGSDGLWEHDGPGAQYAHVGTMNPPHPLPNGTAVQISCQIKTASQVNGSPVWDLLTDGRWVSDYYLDTPVVGDYSPGIARCVTAHQQ
jgi:surface antigen